LQIQENSGAKPVLNVNWLHFESDNQDDQPRLYACVAKHSRSQAPGLDPNFRFGIDHLQQLAHCGGGFPEASSVPFLSDLDEREEGVQPFLLLPGPQRS
jgi:hypothetical protein